MMPFLDIRSRNVVGIMERKVEVKLQFTLWMEKLITFFLWECIQAFLLCFALLFLGFCAIHHLNLSIEPVEDEMVHSDSESVSEEDEMRPSSFNSEPEEDEMAQSESDSKDGAQADATRSFPVISDTKHVTEQALETEKLEDAVVQADSVVHLLQPSHPSVKEVVTSKFQAIDVQSDHLPILEKVWTKHGDVLEGSAIHSCDTKTMALASLAKIIIILQTNNGNTLSDDQVQYLCSTFSDLQYMRLKVDWLAPCVENALAIHKSNQLQASLLELEKAKARAEEMEQKFLSEMAEMKRGLDNDIRLLTKKMPVSGQIDQKKCLGEGLF
ncbi:Ribosomal RNA large subunit methyltransferase K/L [Bienertia sinuspersici]